MPSPEILDDLSERLRPMFNIEPAADLLTELARDEPEVASSIVEGMRDVLVALNRLVGELDDLRTSAETKAGTFDAVVSRHPELATRPVVTDDELVDELDRAVREAGDAVFAVQVAGRVFPALPYREDTYESDWREERGRVASVARRLARLARERRVVQLRPRVARDGSCKWTMPGGEKSLTTETMRRWTVEAESGDA